MLRLAYGDSGSACKLAGVQIIPLPRVANQILVRTLFRSVRCPRWRIKFSFERCSNQSAAHVGESKSRSNVVQISPLPTLANQILARTLFRSVRCPCGRIKFSLERCPDPSHISLRPQPLESSLGRVPQAADGTCKKFRKPDRVGRRGLSEPREDFSRLLTHVFPLLDSVAHQLASSAVGKFSRAISAGGRLHLQ